MKDLNTLLKEGADDLEIIQNFIQHPIFKEARNDSWFADVNDALNIPMGILVQPFDQLPDYVREDLPERTIESGVIMDVAHDNYIENIYIDTHIEPEVKDFIIKTSTLNNWFVDMMEDVEEEYKTFFAPIFYNKFAIELILPEEEVTKIISDVTLAYADMGKSVESDEYVLDLYKSLTDHFEVDDYYVTMFFNINNEFYGGVE